MLQISWNYKYTKIFSVDTVLMHLLLILNINNGVEKIIWLARNFIVAVERYMQKIVCALLLGFSL